MQSAPFNPYTTLGLDRRCSHEQIRIAYRILAKQFHPDRNPGSAEALHQTQALNAAYGILSDPDRRAAFDRELDAPPSKNSSTARYQKIQKSLSHDVFLRLEDFLRGAAREIRINDSANPDGAEIYELIIPAGSAPGTCFRVPRLGAFAGGNVKLRIKPLPHPRFKVRGPDLRCDLKIKPSRAREGGVEMIASLTGTMLRVLIPRGAGRNELVRLPSEGLPRPRGGRGDLLVRITYPIEIRITPANSW